MKYEDFRNTVADYPVIRSQIFDHICEDVATLRRQVSEWVQKKRLIQLKRGIYILNTADRKTTVSKFFVANQLYSPSYISLETALSFYGMIPELVTRITSVTTKKTNQFVSEFGDFTYNHIKPDFYSGYEAKVIDSDQQVLIATREKSLIDFFYLRLRYIKKFDQDIFRLSYRFQNLEAIDFGRLMEYAKLIGKAKLIKLTELFIRFCEEEYD